jgi:hypothetical protein
MRFGIIVLAVLIVSSTAMPAIAWAQHGGRGGAAPRVPHFNPPSAPHVNQPSQPHSNNQHNQPNGMKSNELVFPEYNQQGAQAVYRSRARLRAMNAKLAQQGTAGTAAAHVKPKLNSGQVGSTRNQGNAKSIGLPAPSSMGESLATDGTSTAAATRATSRTGAIGAPDSRMSTRTMAIRSHGATSVTAGTSTSTAYPYTVLAAATQVSGKAMLPYLFNHSGTTTYGFHPRHYYRYGNLYGAQSLYNANYFGQMRAISRLTNDLNSLTKGAVVNPGHINRIRNDLMEVVSATGRPPFQTVHQLSTALVNALPKRNIPMLNTGQLARDLAVVMNGNGMSLMQIQQSIGSAQGVLHSSGVSQPGVQSVTEGLRMVASWGNPSNPLALIP